MVGRFLTNRRGSVVVEQDTGVFAGAVNNDDTVTATEYVPNDRAFLIDSRWLCSTNRIKLTHEHFFFGKTQIDGLHRFFHGEQWYAGE